MFNRGRGFGDRGGRGGPDFNRGAGRGGGSGSAFNELQQAEIRRRREHIRDLIATLRSLGEDRYEIDGKIDDKFHDIQESMRQECIDEFGEEDGEREFNRRTLPTHPSYNGPREHRDYLALERERDLLDRQINMVVQLLEQLGVPFLKQQQIIYLNAPISDEDDDDEWPVVMNLSTGWIAPRRGGRGGGGGGGGGGRGGGGDSSSSASAPGKITSMRLSSAGKFEASGDPPGRGRGFGDRGGGRGRGGPDFTRGAGRGGGGRGGSAEAAAAEERHVRRRQLARDMVRQARLLREAIAMYEQQLTELFGVIQEANLQEAIDIFGEEAGRSRVANPREHPAYLALQAEIDSLQQDYNDTVDRLRMLGDNFDSYDDEPPFDASGKFKAGGVTKEDALRLQGFAGGDGNVHTQAGEPRPGGWASAAPARGGASSSSASAAPLGRQTVQLSDLCEKCQKMTKEKDNPTEYDFCPKCRQFIRSKWTPHRILELAGRR